ncbi:MAG: hypothetical protein IKX14_07190, partial [Neisseriaceae bacterium]|nr:hypothetical protein [Neisseriaceae bacterium]
MNKQYRVIFNQQRNQFVVVSEDTHAHGKSCQSTVSSMAGEMALTAVMAATAIGASVMATPVAADTWSVKSSSEYSNGRANGTYTGNFYRPGWTGSAGFYDSIGETESLNILIGKHNANNSEYENAQVNLGGAKDTTNLENVKKSLGVIRRTNELRKEEGVGELKITHRLMAGAQWQGDYSTVKRGHHMKYGWADNLAWGYQSGEAAANGWYKEKANCENGKRQGCTWRASAPVTGHYLNMVNPDFNATGASSTGDYGTWEGVYGYIVDKSFTPDEYEKMIDDFIAQGGQSFYNANQIVEVVGDIGNNSVTAGYAVAGKNATGNTLNINAKVGGKAYGGYAVNGNTSNNTVNIKANISTVYGGFSENNSASHTNNTINIQSTVDNVFLGNGKTVGGTVNFISGTVSGSLKAVDGNGTAQNAVLNVGATDYSTPMNTLKVGGEVGGFNTYNFYLPRNVSNGDTALQANKATLGNAQVNVYMPGDATVNSGDTLHLIHTTNGVQWTGSGSLKQGVTLEYKIALDGNQQNLDLSFASTSEPVT